MKSAMRGEFDLPELIFDGLAVKPDGRTLAKLLPDAIRRRAELPAGEVHYTCNTSSVFQLESSIHRGGGRRSQNPYALFEHLLGFGWHVFALTRDGRVRWVLVSTDDLLDVITFPDGTILNSLPVKDVLQCTI